MRSVWSLEVRGFLEFKFKSWEGGSLRMYRFRVSWWVQEFAIWVFPVYGVCG